MPIKLKTCYESQLPEPMFTCIFGRAGELKTVEKNGKSRGRCKDSKEATPDFDVRLGL